MAKTHTSHFEFQEGLGSQNRQFDSRQEKYQTM